MKSLKALLQSMQKKRSLPLRFIYLFVFRLHKLSATASTYWPAENRKKEHF